MTGPPLLAALPKDLEPGNVEEWCASKSNALKLAVFDDPSKSGFTSITAEEAGMTDCFSAFLAGAMLADWACYEHDSDRVDYRRLHDIVSIFPRGFRLWLCPNHEEEFQPVGYTGWYPISQEAFRKAHDAPELLTHRGELWPIPTILSEGNYLWLFNYCILMGFRRSPHSRIMLQSYASDLMSIPVRGMAAAVLSEESKGVVARFGMNYRGDMTHNDVSENVYAVRKD